MQRNLSAVSKRRWPVAVAAGAMLTATLAFGCLPGAANAQERWREHREYRHRDWNGGYYRAPPVVYGSPYYAPYYAPPLIYGPGFSVNIR
jgi:hypothetical protein